MIYSIEGEWLVVNKERVLWSEGFTPVQMEELRSTYQETEDKLRKIIAQNRIWTIEELNEEALAYLFSTDWYVIRRSDTGEPIPEDITLARAAARTRITM